MALLSFGKKAKPEEKEKENWSLVLDRVEDNAAKSNLIRRMAQVFPVSLGEAADLTESTPIILLKQALSLF